MYDKYSGKKVILWLQFTGEYYFQNQVLVNDMFQEKILKEWYENDLRCAIDIKEEKSHHMLCKLQQKILCRICLMQNFSYVFKKICIEILFLYSISVGSDIIYNNKLSII